MLQATDCTALNAQLAQLEPAPTLELLVHTPGWTPRAWRIQHDGPAPPLVRINGVPQALATVDEHTHQAELFWATPDPIEQQWLQIEAQGGGQIQALQAVAGASIWQLLQLRRSDQARSSPEAMWPWLLVCGFQECQGLHQLQGLWEQLNQPLPGAIHPQFHGLLWQHLPQLQQACPLPDRAEALQIWIERHVPELIQLPLTGPPSRITPRRPTLQPFLERPFGVNLMGYATAALGIGEDLRTTQQALEQAAIPVAVLDLPLTTCCANPGLFHQAAAAPDQLAPYAFNILCVTAEEQARFALELGDGLFRERYTIGYWPWELSRWPRPWQPLLPLVDELWASSSHTYQALAEAIAARSQPQLQRMPLAIEPLQPLSPSQRQQWRQHFGLPTGSSLVICSFDGRSSYWRKNPWAAIQAFRRSCRRARGGHEPRLVIKTMHAGMDPRQWHDLQAVAAADPRLILIDQVLSRAEVLGLYGCCDVLLSLHRAEGFGRILAECLAMGLEVVATHYGGNVDFCVGPLAHNVSYSLTPVLPGCYPHHQQQHWAEPNLNDAVSQLSLALQQQPRRDQPELSEEARALTSLTTAAERYAQRLRTLWDQRESLAGQLANN